MRAARDPWSPLRRRVKNAVLLAEPWSLDSFRLERFADARRWYPRGALVARASAGSGDIWAISIHLGLDGAERARQAERVTDARRRARRRARDRRRRPQRDARTCARPHGSPTPSVTPGLRPARARAGRSRRSAPTARIDYVFVGEGGSVVGATVGTARRSRGVGPPTGRRRSSPGRTGESEPGTGAPARVPEELHRHVQREPAHREDQERQHAREEPLEEAPRGGMIHQQPDRRHGVHPTERPTSGPARIRFRSSRAPSCPMGGVGAAMLSTYGETDGRHRPGR